MLDAGSVASVLLHQRLNVLLGCQPREVFVKVFALLDHDLAIQASSGIGAGPEELICVIILRSAPRVVQVRLQC